jgi:Domain of unknown function (DUF1996)
MAYAVRSGAERVCPASHPVATPQLIAHIHYDLAGGRGLALSSGPLHTMHADYFNAWEKSKLAELVRRCLRANRDCGPDQAKGRL